jgi:Cytochrome P460
MKEKLIVWVCAGWLLAVTPILATAAPEFDTGGKLVMPDRTDRWPTIGVTKALQYEGDGGDTFNTVRIDPESYDAYIRTGSFPVGTMMELEIRRLGTDAAPARSGSFQGRLLNRSMHVKDEKGGPGTWTFYAFGRAAKKGTPIARSEDCYSCHDDHARVDTVFTQYYPVLNERRAEALVGKK